MLQFSYKTVTLYYHLYFRLLKIKSWLPFKLYLYITIKENRELKDLNKQNEKSSTRSLLFSVVLLAVITYVWWEYCWLCWHLNGVLIYSTGDDRPAVGCPEWFAVSVIRSASCWLFWVVRCIRDTLGQLLVVLSGSLCP